MHYQSKEHQVACDTRHERQSKLKIRRWSHIATRVQDLEATRHFYEDLLGLPLVYAHVQGKEPADPAEITNYLHAFFELGDGSCIAFFQFAPGIRGEPYPHSRDGFERHLAMQVDTIDDVDAFKARLESNGVSSFIVDHAGFYSLYVNDPDGDTVEITYHKPIVDQFYCQLEPKQLVAKWLTEVAV